jgi:flavin reductase (DIM6/NTAB) family NADH-FMN oxidoreductase RutF
MKKIILSALIVCLFAACKNREKTEKTPEQTVKESIAYLNKEELKAKPFHELYAEITPDQMDGNIIELIKTHNIVITAGKEADYNSMVVGDGGIGILMNKPVTFCGLRGSRYTLEIILKDSIYTMSFFEDRYKDEYMIFGRKSGRDSEKMKETSLTAVVTPSGKIAYKEAFMIIECQLAQTHTVNPKEVYAEHNRKFFEDAYKEVGSYHKIVFGDITNVWIRK